ncbi:hypothetical protein [Actinophytocola oryzae]|uniref:Uncharacterized protein n=1 Tax=Actinophytocola oryzae TaxID=502181 RepID=A0A4R7UYH0_9PSEU|nr:hypothetical protein [Actinophytocola oryzae]TDV40126.1 hypothetical protein CLV71_124145 [Actinophytocola oryzae]
MTWNLGPDEYQYMANQNVASDEAHVEQQIGAVFGDAAFHRYESVYNINQSAPPHELHRVAVNHLDGGDPRHAEEILRSLLRDGHITTQRVYYYVLAVLSDRSLDEIDGEIAGSIKRAYLNFNVQPDEWYTALEVVWRLLQCMGQQIDGHLDQHLMDGTLTEFAALPPRRQSEITRHLDRILNGLVQNRLAETGARWVIAERMEPRRVERAWKFFQPDPAQPRRGEVRSDSVDTAQLRRAGLGGLAFAIGLITSLTTSGSRPFLAILGVLLLGAGGYLTMRNSVDRAARAARLVAKDREHMPVAAQPRPVSPGHWVSTRFVEELYSIVDRRFQEARPHVAGNWQQDNSGVRAYLKVRLLNLYGNAEVPAPAISWLVKWHADRAAEKWRAGSLLDYRAAYVVSTRVTALAVLGGVVAATGLAMLLGAGAAVAAVLLGAGGFHMGKGLIDLLAQRRTTAMAQAEADSLYEEELHAYEHWVALLADRPTDAEMARWLAMDKAFLKAAALNRLRLANNDLVDHIVMTEGAPGAMRARVLHGPPRYSTYVVYIFLLTKSGVRQITVDLDFLQGKARNERRNSFRYEALASASVNEKGVRVANHGNVPPAAIGGTLENEHLRTRSFRLTLVSGENIAVLMENFRNLSDAQLEDEAELARLALQTSGVASALHVLEAVAAEGPDWIVQANERRRRWSSNWDTTETDLFALTTDPTHGGNDIR